eukprot:9941941-Alexandrium_andersonii.AAC.1
MDCALAARRAQSVEQPAAEPSQWAFSGRWARHRLNRWYRAQREAHARFLAEVRGAADEALRHANA